MDEKPTALSSPVEADDIKGTTHKGFWARKEKIAHKDATDERVEVTQTEDKIPPVSFFSLFRYVR